MTTTTPIAARAPSSAVGKFTLVFSIAFTVTYVVCLFRGWPLFTFHPATASLAWGYAAGRRGVGPAMYWYGWTAVCLIVSTTLGLLATLLPDHVARRIPLALVWILPVLAFPLLLYSLMPFWTHH